MNLSHNESWRPKKTYFNIINYNKLIKLLENISKQSS
jgi:hypothetical protein